MHANALQYQYAHHFLHVIALQEGRRPKFARVSTLYYMISSGALNGAFGCELWFNLFLPFCFTGNKAHYFTPAQLYVVHASERILVVDLDNPYVKMRFVSAHVPTSHHLDDRVAFFARLLELLQYSGPG